MIKYDKIIVDVYNYYHRVIETCPQKNPKEFVAQFRNVLSKLAGCTYGDIYLLFDPSGNSSKQKIGLRKCICKTYKENRKKFENSDEGKLKRDSLDLLGSTLLLYPKANVHLYQHPEYEADDYVEKLTETGNCLLITSDEDWARYLEMDRVDMLISGLLPVEENIFTSQSYKIKYGFTPTIATVCIYKALMSDESDGIPGVYKSSKHIILRETVDSTIEALNEVAEMKLSLDQASYLFHSGQGPFYEVGQLLLLSCTEKSLEKIKDTFSDNLKVIGSLLPLSSDIKIETLENKLELFRTGKPFTLNRR